MDFIFIAVIVLGAIGLVAAAVLYLCSKKFAVKEDPRIGEVAALLPQANCGGCGFPGCSGLADALVKGADAGNIEGLSCPVGGSEVMDKVADLLGMAISNSEPKVAVVRCNGTCENRPKVSEYSGLRTCAAMHACGAGETACGFGCLGCGDCVAVCSFGAIRINPETGIAEVDEDKCTGCGACSRACPRHIIEVRKKGPKGRRVYVSCVNHDKGPAAKSACAVACIGCGKCEKESARLEQSPWATTLLTSTQRSVAYAASVRRYARRKPSWLSISPLHVPRSRSMPRRRLQSQLSQQR